VFSDCSEDFSFYVVCELFFVEACFVGEGPDYASRGVWGYGGMGVGAIFHMCLCLLGL